MNTPRSLTSTELQARTDAALELATIVVNLNDSYINGVGEAWIGSALFSHMRKLARAALGQSEIMPDAEFSRFLNWARSEGKDCAYTFDTDRNQWVALNPATADLWQMLAECEPYLKEGETPAQRIQRERRDTGAVLNLLIREKRKSERMVEALRLIASTTTDHGAREEAEQALGTAGVTVALRVEDIGNGWKRQTSLTDAVEVFQQSELDAARVRGEQIAAELAKCVARGDAAGVATDQPNEGKKHG